MVAHSLMVQGGPVKRDQDVAHTFVKHAFDMALAVWPQSMLIPSIPAEYRDADLVEVARRQRIETLSKVDLWDLPFVVVDIETTGSIVGQDGITEIALVAVQCGRIMRRWRSFVNPFQPIPAFISQLTGITNEMVCDAPPARDLLPVILEFVADSVLVGHN